MSLDDRINFVMIVFMIYLIFLKVAIGLLRLFVNYSQISYCNLTCLALFQ